MGNISLGVIGAGNIGKVHIQNARSDESFEITLTAFAERDQARRDEIHGLCPDARAFAEGTDLINSGVCGAVLIAVPHEQHPGLAADAFRAGLHVLCEKPGGVFAKQAQEMIDESKKRPDLAFGMMFNQRTNGLFRKMRELVQGGGLGAVKRVNWIITDWYRPQFYYDSGGWRATWIGEGGGVLINQCPHNLDLMQWICGMPKRLCAFCHEGLWHDIEVEDDVTAYMEWHNGATGVLVTSTADAPGTNRFEITLEGGKLICEENKLKLWRLAENERDYCKKAKSYFDPPPHTVEEIETDGQNPQHMGVLNAFAGHILHGFPLTAHGSEGINSLRLSNAMNLSSWLGQTVEIPVDEDLYVKMLNTKRGIQ